MKISIQEVTITSGETSAIDLWIDDKKVKINVPKEVKAYFNEQFVRDNPTALQKKKYATLMALLRAAYKAGQKAN